MQLSLEKQTRCIGQITRSPLSPEIREGRGDCKICEYSSQKNPKCKAYSPIVFRVFEVVDS